MKSGLTLAAFAVSLCAASFLPSCSTTSTDTGNKLVILHTNDTHSQIDPDRKNNGGVLRRMAVIDSVRQANKNVLLVDAGDAVQGTLYFYLYGGRAEQELMNEMGVDMRILGNHEFDNGMDSLAPVLALSKATKIASNYDLDSSALAGQFVRYEIKEYGDKKIGFIGINLDPTGIISKGNYDGLKFLPIVKTADGLAKELKEEKGVDAVIALSHIGYAPAGLVGDSILAVNSHDIDVIIGGHSHDVIDPNTESGNKRSHMRNIDGKPVLVVQTGKAGRNLGKIEIDLDKLGQDQYPDYELIAIDGRYDNYRNAAIESTIAKYRVGVDSLMQLWVGRTERALDNRDAELLNFFADYVYERGSELADNVDFAIVNKGGLRDGLPEGQFSKGHILNMLPFKNYITVIDVKGNDVQDAFDTMAKRDGDGVSKNVEVEFESDGKGHGKANKIEINGKELDPNRTYRIATIDYLSKGGDYMTALTRGTSVANSPEWVYDDLLEYFTTGKGKKRTLSADSDERWERD